jgi:hypothetical protein
LSIWNWSLCHEGYPPQDLMIGISINTYINTFHNNNQQQLSWIRPSYDLEIINHDVEY